MLIFFIYFSLLCLANLDVLRENLARKIFRAIAAAQDLLSIITMKYKPFFHKL